MNAGKFEVRTEVEGIESKDGRVVPEQVVPDEVLEVDRDLPNIDLHPLSFSSFLTRVFPSSDADPVRYSGVTGLPFPSLPTWTLLSLTSGPGLRRG